MQDRRGITHSMVSDVIKYHSKICEEAERLLDPIPKERRVVVYKVSAGNKTFWVKGLEYLHPADIQKSIEHQEGKTFNDLCWSYLRPQEIEVYSLKEFQQANTTSTVRVIMHKESKEADYLEWA